jgi:R67 dihydrofolate reductase
MIKAIWFFLLHPHKFSHGDWVRKKSRLYSSEWHGRIVGTYKTSTTPEGYVVESYYEKGSVQLYPGHALEHWAGPSGAGGGAR